MKITTLIPTTLNDGTVVPESQLRTIIARFYVAFGGCTVEGKTEGHWVNENGSHFVDNCLKVWSIISDDQIETAEKLVAEIGKELEQEAMYFEVDRQTEVRIIDTK